MQILLQVRPPTACSCVLQQCAVSCRQQARQSTRCCTAVSIAHRHNLADDLYPAAECCDALCPPECDILCITTSETEIRPWLQRGDMVLLWDAPHVHPAPHPLESEPWQCGCCGLSWSEVMPTWHSACPQWQRESQSGVRALPQSLIPLAPLAWYEMSSCPVMTTLLSQPLVLLVPVCIQSFAEAPIRPDAPQMCLADINRPFGESQHDAA